MASLDDSRLRAVRAWAAEKALDYSYSAGPDSSLKARFEGFSAAYSSMVFYIDHLMSSDVYIPFVDGD